MAIFNSFLLNYQRVAMGNEIPFPWTIYIARPLYMFVIYRYL